MKELTREEAIRFAESGIWEDMTARHIAEFQIIQPKLCMPFEVFHKAVEESLRRPVMIHEFGSAGTDQLRAELFLGAEPPTLEEVLSLLPQDKLILIDV